jgi:hypothetical protein
MKTPPTKPPPPKPSDIKPRPLNADKRGRPRKIKNDPRYVKFY